MTRAGHRQFCESDNWILADPPRPYCTAGGPSLYAFVQSEYWGVGFLKYYTLQQVLLFCSLMCSCLALAVSE